MDKLLSYFYPITKKIHSDINGVLEITWYNGKKHLDTANANYSYGSLQKILKFGLHKLNIDHVKSVLILGLGGGSVIQTLQQDFKYSGTITAIDIDPVIIKIAKEEFGIVEDEQLKLICTDALEYVKTNDQKFDLLIIDLFIDITIPKQFFNFSFWKDILTACSTNGSILFNASVKPSNNNAINDVIDFLKTHMYNTEVYEKVNGTNTLIIARGL